MNGLKLLTQDALSDKRTLFKHAIETQQDCFSTHGYPDRPRPTGSIRSVR